jgi:xylose isomerase
MLNNSEYSQLIKERYSSFDSGKGKDFEDGKISLDGLHFYASNLKEAKLISGKQELFENIINRYI